jgi:hypothetical protein
LCGADKADSPDYGACSEAHQKTLEKLVLWANGFKEIGELESPMPLLRGSLDITPEMNLNCFLPVGLDNLHLCSFIKKYIQVGQELLPSKETKTEHKWMVNQLAGRDPIKHQSLFDPQTRGTMREWRKVLTSLVCLALETLENPPHQRFLQVHPLYKMGLVHLAIYIAEIYHDNTEPEDPVQKAKRVLTAQVLGFLVFLVSLRINPTKLVGSYFHDIGGSDHTAWMMAEAGGFQQASCEQDEAEFSGVGEIVRANTNNKYKSAEETSALLQTVLERIAQGRATRAQFEEERKSPTVVASERLWKESGLGTGDIVLPPELIKEQSIVHDGQGQPVAVVSADSRNTEAFLKDVTKRFGGEGEGWWKRLNDGGILFNCGVQTAIATSARVPKVKTAFEAADDRAGVIAGLSRKLERLREMRRKEEAYKAQKQAARKEEAMSLARKCGLQLTRLDVKQLKKILEALNSGKGIGSLNKSALVQKATEALVQNGGMSVDELASPHQPVHFSFWITKELLAECKARGLSSTRKAREDLIEMLLPIL